MTILGYLGLTERQLDDWASPDSFVYPENHIWRSKGSRAWHIYDMELEHLQNTIGFLERAEANLGEENGYRSTNIEEWLNVLQDELLRRVEEASA